VAGKPFLVWILEQLSKTDFTKVVISGGYLFDVLRCEIEPHVPRNMGVVWVNERKPLGTGGGVIHAVRESGLNPKNWLVMNGDSYLAGEWVQIMRESNPLEACIVARKVGDTGRYGRLEAKKGELVAFREKQRGGEGLINAGIYLLPSICLSGAMEQEALSMENDLIPGWLSEGRKIRIQEVDAPFLDIGTPDDYARADAFFAEVEGQA
jgi:D-glycero-alpha-D-manno-heptose 1-phosphate guanylyltransferase